jgi:TonB family protein
MNEPTSNVLIQRAQLEPGARFNLAWSILGHALVGIAIVVWPRAATEPQLRNVMTINLSGSPGPNTGGMTQMGGAVPTPVRPEPPAPPSPPPPAPTPSARPSVAVRPPARTETTPSRRTPAAKEPTEGNTPVVTGARGQGFGLSSSGGNVGRNVEMDVANFCCPEYIERVVLVIQRNWDKEQGVRGSAVVSFTIHRDGRVDGVLVRRSSGFYALDNAALRAMARAKQLPALPTQFTNPTLTLHVTFEYR